MEPEPVAEAPAPVPEPEPAPEPVVEPEPVVSASEPEPTPVAPAPEPTSTPAVPVGEEPPVATPRAEEPASGEDVADEPASGEDAAPKFVGNVEPVAAPAPVEELGVRVSVQAQSSSWRRASESYPMPGVRSAHVSRHSLARATPFAAHEVGTEEWVELKTALQPGLAHVKAHGAWRRKLTGEGVRIAVRDDPLDPASPELEGRISAEGSIQAYWSHWTYGSPCEYAWRRCTQWRSANEDAVRQWASEYIEEKGHPNEDDSVFTQIMESNDWFELPALWDGQQLGVYYSSPPYRSHGTMVASVAAGRHLGVAPGATLVSQAVPFEPGDGTGQYVRMEELAREVVGWGSIGPVLPVEALEAGLVGVVVEGGSSYSLEPATDERRELIDETFAAAIRRGMEDMDVINRSYGYGGDWNDDERASRMGIETARWRAFARSFPETVKAIRQEHLAERDKVVFVSAAGNSYQLHAPNVLARTAVFVPELRGLHIAAKALNDGSFNTDGKPRSGDYSDRCGPLPQDWAPSHHGRHYCISAPGSVRATGPGEDVVTGMSDVQGTSFAAPMVSGGIALVMEAFRGQLTPREVVRRLMDTADNAGIYADPDLYGAGVMDLNAATSPLSVLETGLPGGVAPLEASVLRTPPAWGDLSGRLGSVELASFDERNAPFWSPLSAQVRTAPFTFEPPVPDAEPNEPLAHLGWTDADALNALDVGADWRMSLAASQDGEVGSFALSARPSEGSAWRLGLAFEEGSMQGARSTGAFGAVSSQGVFVSRTHVRRLGNELELELDWTLAAGRAEHSGDAMVQVSPALYTAGSVSLVHEDADGSRTRLTLSQPLRAETGGGELTVPTGRTQEGERTYRTVSFDQSPGVRELRMSVRHDRELGGGKLAVELGVAANAGHVEGRERVFAGLGYRLAW